MRKISIIGYTFLGGLICFVLGFLAGNIFKSDLNLKKETITNLEKKIDGLERTIKELKKETNYFKLLKG